MLSECTGPLNFTMFLSLFAEKYGSTDPENVILNAFSMFDPDETGKIRCKTFKNLLTTVGDRFSKDEVANFFSIIFLRQFCQAFFKCFKFDRWKIFFKICHWAATQRISTTASSQRFSSTAIKMTMTYKTK
jgi:hypothetical protein